MLRGVPEVSPDALVRVVVFSVLIPPLLPIIVAVESASVLSALELLSLASAVVALVADTDIDTDDNERKSFPSGHSTSALRITSYTALYLRRHVFAEMRGDAFISWPEAIAYPALAALAVYVPYTRVVDHRHHVSDVLAGAALGLTYSSLFFWYQESRLQGHQQQKETAVVSPWVSGRGLSVGWSY